MEKWKYVKDSKFYQVSDKGNVRRIGGTIIRNDGKPFSFHSSYVKPFLTKSGYLICPLKLDVNRKMLVHRLVMEAFNPVDNMSELQVNHIDGCKSNNCLSNLEWVTRVGNMRHAMKIGLFKPRDRFGEKHPMCKLSKADVDEIRNSLQSGKRGIQHKLALEYNVSDTTICEIKKNITRKRG